MILTLLLSVIFASPAVAQPPPFERWRVENIESSVTYTPQVIPPPFGVRISEVGVLHESVPGAPAGAVSGSMHIRVNSNYTCDCGTVTALGHFEFDFISDVESEINLSIGGRFGMISMSGTGSDVIWQYPDTIDPLEPLTISPGMYHFVGRMEGSGLDPNDWGQVRLSIFPVPEPNTVALATMALLLFYLAIHRRMRNGFRFHAGTVASGASGGK
jgi:hypothetical protein